MVVSRLGTVGNTDHALIDGVMVLVVMEEVGHLVDECILGEDCELKSATTGRAKAADVRGGREDI